MALRMVEVVLPAERREAVREALAGATVLESWEDRLDEDRVELRCLVETGHVEALLDEIEQRLAWSEGFRIVVTRVEATLPRLEPPAKAREEGEPVGQTRGPSRISREELLADLSEGTRVTPTFFATVLLSSVVAAVGLLRDDVAIVVAAMVIAPLLTPNMALALATTLGDLDLGRRALRCNAIGATAALAFACAVGVALDFDAERAQIAARAHVGLPDLVLALAAGSAGALAFTTGVPVGLVGVMVAVALLPPLVVTGLLAGSGRWALDGGAAGAATLLAINVVCVQLTGVATFRLQGVKPRTWWEEGKARAASRRALLLWGGLVLALVALVVLASKQ